MGSQDGRCGTTEFPIQIFLALLSQALRSGDDEAMDLGLIVRCQHLMNLIVPEIQNQSWEVKGARDQREHSGEGICLACG